MSADSWAICPKCRQETERIQNEAQSLYGKIPYSDWNDMIKDLPDEEDYPTEFREEYWIWTDKDGIFHVDYNGECQKCEFEVKFEHSHNVMEDE